MTRIAFLCASLVLIGSAQVSADDLAAVLKLPIIGAQLSLEEVQTYTERRVPVVPTFASTDEWTAYAKKIRRDTLDQVVYRGEAAKWRDAAGKVEWQGEIEGGPEYRIKKLRYEAVPGLWIPALLYEPKELKGKVPAIMNVNGHDGNGKAADYKQIRCINQAKKGMLALNVEWLGMGQLRADGYMHYRMNQLDLCGTSGLAPFYLNMKRGLDVLLAHPNADTTRVAVAGLSGGGWQTIYISALDERVTLSDPVAGYSSFRTRARNFSDLGDSEQTPCDMATVADYTHFTAIRAPHPTLLTFNLTDNCCFASDHALPPLLDAARPIYQLFGKEQNLRWHVNVAPGDHNFGKDNREALYRAFRDYFYAGQPFDATEIACDKEVKKADELKVELPADNKDFRKLAAELAQALPLDPSLPSERSAAAGWQEKRRAALKQTIKTKEYTVSAIKAGEKMVGDRAATLWRLRMNEDWTVPAVEIAGADAKGNVILIADVGRGESAPEVQKLLDQGYRVVAVDPFYFGESKIASRDFLFALMVATVGDRAIGLQASQIAAVARWLKTREPRQPVTLVAAGVRSSAFGLIAAGIEAEAIDNVRLHGSLGSIRQVIEKDWAVNQYPELFCFGLLKEFDVKQIAALVAPRPVEFVAPDDRVKSELAELVRWYALFDAKWQVGG